MHQPPPAATSPPPRRQGAAREEDVVIAVQQALAAQRRDFSLILLASKLGAGCSVLEAAASLGRTDLLADFLYTFYTSSTPPNTHSDVCAAALAAVAKRQPWSLQLLLHFSTLSTSPSTSQLLDARATFGRTLLHLAADNGCVDCMQLLLQHSPLTQVAATDTKGRTPLMYAASSGHASCVSLLLAHSPDTQVAAVSPDVWTALLAAAIDGHTSCMQLLLAHSPGVQVAVTMHDGRNALSVAAGYAAVGCLQLLLAHSPTQQQLDRALLEAGESLAMHYRREDDTPEEELEQEDPSVQEQYEQGLKKCIERLLANGAMLTAPDSEDAMTVIRCINKELAARALVPEMANEAVVGLASAFAERKWRRASGQDAAGPRTEARPSL